MLIFQASWTTLQGKIGSPKFIMRKCVFRVHIVCIGIFDSNINMSKYLLGAIIYSLKNIISLTLNTMN